jgi:hypothetical protein
VFPPYGALAGELILGNEAVIECDGLAQAFLVIPERDEVASPESIAIAWRVKPPTVSHRSRCVIFRSWRAKNPPRKKTGNSGFVLGRERFAKISAVEGIALSGAMKKRIRESDRKGSSAEARRAAIIRAHSEG